jgi:sugar lactone lactonase YvrE
MFGTTIAGITGNYGSSYSQLYLPTAIYVNPNGTMYIIDWSNCRVMKWQQGDPLGSVVAGGHGCGSSLTQMDNSYGLFVDNQSNIYISEYQNHRVVKWFPSNTTAGVLVLLFYH